MSENHPEEIKRDKFGGIIGETHETPDMVRWFSNGSHYFLKHNSPDRPIFALGMEHQIGDLAYIFDTSIEFDDDEAPDLMDQIAEFNGLPKYSTLKRQVDMLKRMARDLDQPSQPVAILKRAILGDLEDIILEG